MVTNDIIDTINQWTTWASSGTGGRYDIALLKIWIQFEKFMAEIFVQYAMGNNSEEGYCPHLKLHFSSEEQLNAILREGNRTYVDYQAQIRKLSKHFFSSDPFDVIFADADRKTAYDQLVAIRNYIAHESGEAKSKLIKYCFGGKPDKFLEPNDYLLTKEKRTNQTYYSYYTKIIKDAVLLLVNPPT